MLTKQTIRFLSRGRARGLIAGGKLVVLNEIIMWQIMLLLCKISHKIIKINEIFLPLDRFPLVLSFFFWLVKPAIKLFIWWSNLFFLQISNSLALHCKSNFLLYYNNLRLTSVNEFPIFASVELRQLRRKTFSMVF